MPIGFRWIFSSLIALILIGIPVVIYRSGYAHHKRLREVTPGVLYRSGQLTAEGFRDAVARFGIRTIVNCQNEFPDPDLPMTFWLRETVRESELCRDLGVRYIHLEPDLIDQRCDPSARPRVIDEFLSIMDDPDAHPVLLHCRAGLHRTGVLVAAYRQEFDGWGPFLALQELKEHGFGNFAATAANDYIRQYVLNFRPRTKCQRTEDGGRKSEDSSLFRLLHSVLRPPSS
jgi:tyrosine-protein phosphatase SIW14